jgi:hypothetical protein
VGLSVPGSLPSCTIILSNTWPDRVLLLSGLGDMPPTTPHVTQMPFSSHLGTVHATSHVLSDRLDRGGTLGVDVNLPNILDA